VARISGNKWPEFPEPTIGRTAARDGHRLQLQGFTVSQVVHDYGDVCQSITDLTLQLNAPISVEDFRTLNRCLDDAIASAVTEYGRDKQPLLDPQADRDHERLGFLAHEMRNLVGTASFAFSKPATSASLAAREMCFNEVSRRFAISSPDRLPRFAFGMTFTRPRVSASPNSLRISSPRRAWTQMPVDCGSSWSLVTRRSRSRRTDPFSPRVW
jgi:hypothetical protein